MDKYIGKRLDGRYEIHELLGVGGMAYVYRAYDKIESRWVAIKILKEELSNNSDFLRRFRNESKAIAVLSHPNIVKVYDVSFGDRIQYIVMEFIDGITLKQYIEQQGEIKWREALYFTVQILRALQHAHEKGIIHRDIKPQNIMLLEDGTIKVTDFGIARFSQAETQTMTDKAIGSVHYIAPEQARGGYINDKADIYSVGVMLYEMLTGQLPFVADNAVSVAIMQMQAEPTPPTRINPAIPKGLEEITMHAMEKNPAQRFPSAADMLEDVERFRRNPEIVFNYGNQMDHAYARGTDIYDDVRSTPQKYNDNYEYEEEYVRSKNGARASMIITGIVVAILAVGLVVGGIFLWNYFQNLSTEEVSDEIDLPNFVGKIYETEIKDNPEYADLEFEITMGNVPSKAAGEVLRQTPAAGMKVKKGKTISLTVNGELEKVVVEETKGDKQQDAYNKLKALGLNPEIQAVADDETAVGYVVKTNPAAGTEVTTGTKITIFVSSGPSKEKVKVPQVVGSTLATAKSDLEASGFVIGDIRYDDESDKDEGTVLSCDPKSGDEAPKGSAVNLVVSSGKGATKTVQYDIPLPSNVYEDLVMKIYVDGELFDTRTVNPSVSMYTGASFSGTGRASLTIRLNDQDYISAEINYDTQSIDVYSQLPYTTPEPAPTDPPEEPESSTDEPDDGQITTH
ncbi:Stk1 family PASTA domain-containing Ser/Thr kinase [Anaeromassilibacillus senegalensis]|uniref:non-specific serine/threonine protein kinase n=1 Tax=Anaeromassilibacillus senegalensis TaxID=1673717 RepID=A0ABS9CKV9_9FIRM|nr:Stk1 family PASTA domain-containing Ser/Thr kinase [Anaeromassilibacillus senegalensis]MCF2651573.1 Stk1 family PASTA domain-containing Ser/Thr kinase [Anaeromassilibacillus senegalensis]